MMSDEELGAELKRATDGLLFMSESDYPIEVVKWDGREQLSYDDLRTAAAQSADSQVVETCGADAAAPVQESSLADFFGVAVGEQDWKGAAELATAKRYQALVRLLEENLTGAKAYRVGQIDIGVFVVGKTEAGNWMGVSTRVVET